MSNVFLEYDASAFAKVQSQLQELQGANMDKILTRMATAGAASLKPPLKAAAPVKSFGGKRGNGYGEPGDLRDSIKMRRAKHQGDGGIAAVVGPMGKRAFMRHWVIGGTKPHDEPKFGSNRHVVMTFLGRAASIVHHPGARSNPFVKRIGDAGHGLVRNAMVESLNRDIKRIRGR
jgi:hypothetical protein